MGFQDVQHRDHVRIPSFSSLCSCWDFPYSFCPFSLEPFQLHLHSVETLRTISWVGQAPSAWTGDPRSERDGNDNCRVAEERSLT